MGKVSKLAKIALAGFLTLQSPNLVAPDFPLKEPHEPKKTLVIDGGHDKKNKGKGHKKEYIYNQKVAEEIKKILEPYGYNVILTRKDNSPVNSGKMYRGDINKDRRVNIEDELLARNKFSQYYDAYAFMSIHFDYNKKDTTSKTQIIYYGITDIDQMGDKKKNFTRYKDLNYWDDASQKFASELAVYHRNQGILTEDYGMDLGILFMNKANKEVIIECDNLANPRIKKFLDTEKGIRHYAENVANAFLYAESQKRKTPKLIREYFE